MSIKVAPPSVLTPSEAAARIGTNVPGLVGLIRVYQYRFTELKPGGKPGDRGRNRWGLSEAQVAAIIKGQERTLPDPKADDPDRPPAPSADSPDGKSRLRRPKWARG